MASVRLAPTVSSVFPPCLSFIYGGVYVPVSWRQEAVCSQHLGLRKCLAGWGTVFFSVSSREHQKILWVKGDWKLGHVKWAKCNRWHILQDALFSFCRNPRKCLLLFFSFCTSESWTSAGTMTCLRSPKLADGGLNVGTVGLYSRCSFFGL